MKHNRIFTIPNVLTIVRFAAFFPAAFLVAEGTRRANLQACALLALMAMTDFLDGFIARHYNQKSELGRVIDPVVDKICVGGLFVLLAWQRELPWWIVWMVVGRDLLILAAGVFILGRHHRVTESTIVGKVAVGVIGATLFVFLFDITALKPVAIHGSAVAVLVSTVAYAVRFVRIMAGKELVPPVAAFEWAGEEKPGSSESS